MEAKTFAKESHGSIMLPWRTLVFASGALLAYIIFGAAPDTWVFDRTAISQGEWWRLFTAHWVHSDMAHAGWDIAALLLLGLLFEHSLHKWLALSLFVGSLSVDIWLWYGYLNLEYYCGLSGILNTLLAFGLMQMWRKQPHPIVLLTGLGAVLKILVELNMGQSLLTDTLWPSVPSVHAVGFIAGIVLGVIVNINISMKPRDV